MTQLFSILSGCHADAFRFITGLAIASLIAVAAGCGMTSSPNIQTPIPIPTPIPDTQPPTSTITSPTAGTNIPVGTTVTITGTASDTGGGSVQSVQVSVDGGVTYNTAMGTTMWSYNWTPTSAGLALIKSRSVDDRGNRQTTPASIIITVVDPGSPLRIVSTTPAPSATDVPTGVTPTAVFSKALGLGSLSISNPDIATILMRDASNNPVPFNLYVHVPTLRVILLPEQELQPNQTYTLTFKGGPDAPHITDEAGMPLASDYILSFTTTGSRITASTIFADAPRNPIVNDPSPAELGVKFRSDAPGLIGGVRFYKGAPRTAAST